MPPSLPPSPLPPSFFLIGGSDNLVGKLGLPPLSIGGFKGKVEVMELEVDGKRKRPSNVVALYLRWPPFQNIYLSAFPTPRYFYYLLRCGISEIRPWKGEGGKRKGDHAGRKEDKLPLERERLSACCRRTACLGSAQSLQKFCKLSRP